VLTPFDTADADRLFGLLTARLGSHNGSDAVFRARATDLAKAVVLTLIWMRSGRRSAGFSGLKNRENPALDLHEYVYVPILPLLGLDPSPLQ